MDRVDFGPSCPSFVLNTTRYTGGGGGGGGGGQRFSEKPILVPG